ncbi:MAG: HAD family hydrolase [Clostridiaceae bacterium]|nr:HAD family hydrolase [Clostridiaceae bacterium]
MESRKKPAAILKDIKRIIFDMDGVITSEQNYWNAAALTVHEMLTSNKYLGNKNIETDLSEERVREIRETVFLKDRWIGLLKDRGVNTNWDLAYVVLCMVLITKSRQAIPQYEFDASLFRDAYDFFVKQPLQGYEIYAYIQSNLTKVMGEDESYFSRSGTFWKICQDVFQEWYLGDLAYTETYGRLPRQEGKRGLIYSEQPLIPLHELKEVIHVLYDAGICLGVGTGRPYVEIDQPLVSWGLRQYFDSRSFITYTEVSRAEKLLGLTEKGINLAKPHPYVFLKAIYGKDYPDDALLEGNYDKSLISGSLIVGDAGSDIMAAKAIGCKFAAVLTGVSGSKAAEYFRKMNADYILNSVKELIK